MSKKFEPKTRIKVENLVPWEVGFPCYTIRGKEQGLIISGSQIHGQLTYEEIEEQINSENVAFCGVDGRGAQSSFPRAEYNRLSNPINEKSY